MADYIKGYLEALGFLPYEDEAGEQLGGTAGNVVATIPATADAPSIMFASHMDTVEPSEGVEPVILGDIISSKGHTILGADDKVGVAAMLELASILVDKSIPHGPVHLAFTIAEEVGLHGAKLLDLSDKKIDYIYVLDADGDVGTIVVAAPYQDSFDVEFRGKAAHAGVEPEKGINAIVAAAKAISCMRLGRIDEETTANVGIIEGGRAGNIIPERVSIFAECRSIDYDKLEAQAHHMIECFEQGADEVGADVTIRRIRPYSGYEVTEDDPVVRRAIQAAVALGLTPQMKRSGGGSDTNIFSNQIGDKSVDAVNLGVGFRNVHSENEYIEIGQMVNLAKLLLELTKA